MVGAKQLNSESRAFFSHRPHERFPHSYTVMAKDAEAFKNKAFKRQPTRYVAQRRTPVDGIQGATYFLGAERSAGQEPCFLCQE